MDIVAFPRFSSENTAVWFAQVEAVFALNGVISESDKYDYIVTQIPKECLSVVKDIILNPPPTDRYDHIKNEIIKRISIQRLKKEDLGNSKPSEYLLRLKNLADERVSAPTILHIWLNNLPVQVREIVCLEASGDVDVLCKIADKVMTLASQTTQQQPSNLNLPGDQFGIIVHRLEDLAKQLQALRMMIEGDTSKRIGGQQYVITPINSNQQTVAANSNTESLKFIDKSKPPGIQKVVCWYHGVYGDRAAACIAPCQYNVLPQQYL